MIRTIINGACMSLADSVPGVSGGTVAFIMGFYDDFIRSTNDIFYKKGEDRKRAIFYLIKLGIGWAIGMITSVLILTAAFEKYIYVVSSLFFGFIIASIPMLIKEEKKSFFISRYNLICLFVGIAVVVTITIISKLSFVSGISFGLSSLTVPLIIYIFIGGIVSTSAMFLPGISGSTILLVLGLYIPVMKAGREFLSLNLSFLPGLLIFLGGIIVGALSVVKVIQFTLERFRPQMMFLIMGLMIGSLFSIVMGPTTIENPQPPLNIGVFNWIAFAIGIGLIALLQFVGRKKEMETGSSSSGDVTKERRGSGHSGNTRISERNRRTRTSEMRRDGMDRTSEMRGDGRAHRSDGMQRDGRSHVQEMNDDHVRRERTSVVRDRDSLHEEVSDIRRRVRRRTSETERDFDDHDDPVT